MAVSAILVITLAASWTTPTQGSNSKFLTSPHHRTSLSSLVFEEDVMNAMGSMLGCGGQASPEKQASIRSTLSPMFRTMKKTSSGRIDRRSLRYLVHRYFMQTSSLMIRGFEPTRPTNDSNWGVADVLSQVVPAYVESVLESSHAMQQGFSLDDAVNMVLMLDQLIFDAESSLLEGVYAKLRKPIQQSLTQAALYEILEVYMVEWMVEGDDDDIAMLLSNRSLLSEVVPHFDELTKFAMGRMKTLQYGREKKVPKGHGRDTWAKKYSFEDAHEIVGGITRSFQSYWQSECESMKGALVSMDSHHTGRVPLSKFYGTAIDTDWRFGESEAYLRELGALDESSSWIGPQVVIPNYLQAISNCIVSTPHYLVCCVNECETLLAEIEVAIGSPTATATDILQIVRNMTAQATIDDDELSQLPPDGTLAQQLQQVADTNGGAVPLHGRLFAQWLHYVFPRECPFPHKMGMVSAVTPGQYGEDYIATDEDMKKHASNTTASKVHFSVGKDELHWMSQWSPEEELIVDISDELSMSWQKRLLIACGGLLLIGIGGYRGIVQRGKPYTSASSFSGRVHLV